MSNQWDSIGKGFCEFLFNGYPEIVNCVTSLAMLIVGLAGLYKSNLKPYGVKTIYTDFIINSFGSTLFHYNGFKYYGVIDVTTMLIISWTLAYIIGNGLFTFIRNKKLREFLDDNWALFIRTFMMLTVASAVVSGKPWNVNFTFTDSFVVPTIISIVGMFILMGLTIRKLELRIFIYLSIGLAMMVFAALIWGLTEPYCDGIRGTSEEPNGFMKVSHGLWHVFFSFGAHYFIQCVLYMRYVAEDKTVYIVNNEGCCNHVIDIVTMTVNSDDTISI